MEETSKQCQWRDCEQEGHFHQAVAFKAFNAKLGGIYLCGEHCKQARRTSHMDILISQIRMEKAKGGL